MVYSFWFVVDPVAGYGLLVVVLHLPSGELNAGSVLGLEYQGIHLSGGEEMVGGDSCARG